MKIILPEISIDKKELASLSRERKEEWDKEVLKNTLDTFEQFKRDNPEAAKYLTKEDIKKQKHSFSDFLDIFPNIPSKLQRQSINSLLADPKTYETVPEAILALQQKQLEIEAKDNKNVAKLIFNNYYAKKQKERFGNLIPELQEIELAMGGIYGSKGKKYLHIDAAANTFNNALTFGVLGDKFIDPIYGERIQEKYKWASRLGGALGSILNLSVLSKIAVGMGLPGRIASATDKIKPLVALRNMSGAAKYHIAEKIAPTRFTLNALSKAAGKTGWAWLDRTAATTAAATKYGIYGTGKAAYRMVGAEGFTQATVGAFSELMRIGSKSFYKQDGMDWKEFVKQAPMGALSGGWNRWAIGLINDPSGWWGRFVGDALYSSYEQGVNMLKTGGKWNWDEFWYSYIVGHAMGEVQGLMFGANRQKQLDIVKSNLYQRAASIVKQNTDQKFITKNGTFKEYLEGLSTAALVELQKGSLDTHGRTPTGAMLKEAFMGMNVFQNDIFNIVATTFNNRPYVIDMKAIREGNSFREADKVIPINTKRIDTILKQSNEYKNIEKSDLISDKDFYDWFFKTLTKTTPEKLDSSFSKHSEEILSQSKTERDKQIRQAEQKIKSKSSEELKLIEGADKIIDRFARTKPNEKSKETIYEILSNNQNYGDYIPEALMSLFSREKVNIGGKSKNTLDLSNSEIKGLITNKAKLLKINALQTKTGQEITTIDKDIAEDLTFKDKLVAPIATTDRERKEVLTKIKSIIDNEQYKIEKGLELEDKKYVQTKKSIDKKKAIYKLYADAAAFILNRIEGKNTKLIARILDDIELKPYKGLFWSKKDSGEEIKLTARHYKVENAINDFEKLYKREKDISAYDIKLTDTTEKITKEIKEQTYTRGKTKIELKGLNPNTGLRSVLTGIDKTDISKNGGTIFSIHKYYNEIKNIFGEAVGQEFIYRSSKLIKDTINTVKGGDEVKIFNPNEHDGTVFVFSGKDKNVVDLVTQKIKEKFVDNYRDSDFCMPLLGDEEVQYIITDFKDVDIMRINHGEEVDTNFIANNFEKIKTFEALKKFVALSNPNKANILTEIEPDNADSKKILDKVNKVLPIKDIDSLEKMHEFIEKYTGTENGRAKIDEVLGLADELINKGEIKDTIEFLFTHKDEDGKYVKNEGNAFNRTIEDYVKKTIEDLDLQNMTSVGINKVNDLMEAGKGAFKGLWGIGKSARQFMVDMTTVYGMREEKSLEARRAYQTLNKMRHSISDYGTGDMVAGRIIKCYLLESGLIGQNKGALKILNILGHKLHENENKYIKDRYAKNPELLRKEKIEFKTEEDKRRYTEILKARKPSDWTQLDITNFNDSCKHTEVPLSKVLVQYYGLDPKALVKWFEIRQRFQDMTRDRVVDDLNFDLFKHMRTTANNKIQELIGKTGSKKKPNLFHLDKNSTELDAFRNLVAGTRYEKEFNYQVERFYEIDPEKLSYVKHHIIANNKGKFFNNVMRAFSQSRDFRGEEVAETTLRAYMGREFGTLDQATRNGYEVSSTMFEDMASELKYIYTKEVMNESAKYLKKTFMNQLLSSPDPIGYLRNHESGIIYIPSVHDISQQDDLIDKYKKRLELANKNADIISSTKYNALMDEALTTKELLEQTRDLLLQTGYGLSKNQKRKLKKDKNIPEYSKTGLKIDEETIKNRTELQIKNRELVAKALFGEDYSTKYIPANWKDWQANSIAKEIESNNYKINIGGVKDEFRFIKNGITEGFHGLTKRSLRFEAGNLRGWEGVYFHADAWKAFKNLVLRDDYLKYNSDYEFYNKTLKAYDKINLVMKLLRLYKPTMVFTFDAVQSMMANPMYIKNLKWGFEQALKEVNLEELDPVFEHARVNNTFDTVVGTAPVVSASERAIYKMLGSTGILGDFKAKFDEQPTMLKKIGVLANIYQSSAWLGDKVIRAALYKAEWDKQTRGKTLTRQEANDMASKVAEYTKLFTVNYSRMPMSTRQMANRFAFALTYKVQTLRMYKEMLKMAGSGVKNLFTDTNDENYVFSSSRETKLQQTMDLMAPLLRTIIMTGGLKLILNQVFDWGYDSWWDALFGYRTKKLDEDNPMGEVIKYFAMGTPLFEIEKILTRPFKVTLKYNAAPLPGTILSIMNNSDMITGEKMWDTKGYSNKESVLRMPHRTAAGIGMSLLKSYFPFGADISNFNEENLSLIQKIINFSGLGYYYSTKSPGQLLQEFKDAYDVSKTQGERDKAYRNFIQGLNRAHKALFNEKYKDVAMMLEEIRDKRRRYDY